MRKTDSSDLKEELEKLLTARNAIVENIENINRSQPKWTRLQYGDNVEITGRNTHIERLFECVTAVGATSMRDARLLFVSNAPYREKEIYTLKFPDGSTACAIVESVNEVPPINSNRVVFRLL